MNSDFLLNFLFFALACFYKPRSPKLILLRRFYTLIAFSLLICDLIPAGLILVSFLLLNFSRNFRGAGEYIVFLSLTTLASLAIGFHLMTGGEAPTWVTVVPLILQIGFVLGFIFVDFKLQHRWLTHFSKVAKQVAHDIRSPCSALNMATGKLKMSQQFDELVDLLKMSSDRIILIADNLLHSSKQSFEPVESRILNREIETLIQSKEIEFRSRVRISLSGPREIRLLKVSTRQMSDLTRVLSNLMNNSFEAGAFDINVNLSVFENILQISVEDSGSGISLQQQELVGGEIAFTSKKSGSGLGLSSARGFAKRFGGNFDLSSDDGLTRACIRLPVTHSIDGIALNQARDVSSRHPFWQAEDMI